MNDESRGDARLAGFRVARYNSLRPFERREGNRAPRGVACTLNHFDYPRFPSIKTFGVITLVQLRTASTNCYLITLFNLTLWVRGRWLLRAARGARYWLNLSIASELIVDFLINLRAVHARCACRRKASRRRPPTARNRATDIFVHFNDELCAPQPR